MRLPDGKVSERGARDFIRIVSGASGRIVQESLENVAAHSGSRKAMVQISRTSDELEVNVRDWGKGMSPEARSGTGILGMRERVRLLGALLEIGPAEPGLNVRAVFSTEAE
jgi:signal transduction histidine kinase